MNDRNVLLLHLADVQSEAVSKSFYTGQFLQWDPPLGSGANRTKTGDDEQTPRFVLVEESFKDRHLDREIVVLCVRWHLSYKLSYRDLVAMMNERGTDRAHTTILRWMQHYSPEFEKRWKRFARSVGGSRRVDEAYIRIKGAGT